MGCGGKGGILGQMYAPIGHFLSCLIKIYFHTYPRSQGEYGHVFFILTLGAGVSKAMYFSYSFV